MEGSGLGIVTAGELVPGVVGDAVAVGVVADHDDSGLGGAAVVAAGGGEGVAVDLEVILSRLVGHGVVEAEDDIAAVGAQAYHGAAGLPGQVLLALGVHAGLRVAVLVLGNGVGELSGGRHEVVDLGDVGAVGQSRCAQAEEGGE